MIEQQAIPGIPRDFYASDKALQGMLRQHLSPEEWSWAEPLLSDLGRLATGPFNSLAEIANQNPPQLKQYDAHGNRIDEVVVHPSYRELTRGAFGFGLGGMFYNPVFRSRYGYVPHSVVFGLGYLFGQAEQGLFCPICMTEGAARVLDKFGDRQLRENYLSRLASNDPDTLLQGAMFLTEKQGGSDVGANTTMARQVGDHWELWGDKWFCSNAGEAGVMLVLARPEGAPAGTKGLGLFLMPKEWDGGRNTHRINRLKDKLGTRSMPSGEMTLEGAKAYAVGDVSRGFHYMAEMMNLCRIYNAVGSLAVMRRALYEAIQHSQARVAFGNRIDAYPMVRQHLVTLSEEHEASMALVWEAIRLLDRQDRGLSNEDERRILRLLTPQIKYLTARQAVDFSSQACEFLGGNGYIETFVTPRLLRDAQVLPIWEGTTNILVLDVLRCLEKEASHEPLFAMFAERLSRIGHPALQDERLLVQQGLGTLQQALSELVNAGRGLTMHAKSWSDRAIELFQSVLLLEEAERELGIGQGRKLAIARRFIRRHLAPIPFGALGWCADQSADQLFDAIVLHAPLTAEQARVMVG